MMTSAKATGFHGLESTELFPPTEMLTRDGISVVTSEKFSVRDPDSNATYAFAFSAMPVSKDIAASTYRMARRYLMTKSLSYACRSLNLFQDMLRAGAESVGGTLQSIDLTVINSWKIAREARSAKFDVALAFVIPWLRRWAEAGEGCVSEEISAYLLDHVGTTKNQAYIALQTNDPERGALTRHEMSALTAELNSQFAGGRISLETYALMWLLIGTGIRPIQIARMRVGDVVRDGVEGSTDVYLSIPLAKGEGAYEGHRWGLRAPTVLAEVLRHYLDEYGLHNPRIPLFRAKFNASMPTSPMTLHRKIVTVGQQLNVFSARVDGPIPLFPYRFRYTVGTRAVEMGANDHVVARLLTQRSTYSAKSYRAATVGGQKAIAAALGDELEVIARAFRGEIVPSGTNGVEVRTLIRDFERLSGRSLGGCGSDTKCLQHAPIACLTCSRFKAFDDAPFDDLRRQLVSEQAEEPDIKIRQIYDEPIAALDELINLCESADSNTIDGAKE